MRIAMPGAMVKQLCNNAVVQKCGGAVAWWYSRAAAQRCASAAMRWCNGRVE